MIYRFIILFLALVIISSCSDDNSTNNPSSDLTGTWYGEFYTETDSISYSCTISEKNGKISGTGDLSGVLIRYSQNIRESEAKRRKTSVEGVYAYPDLSVKFVNDTSNHFTGVLSEDKMKIDGRVFIYFTLVDSTLEYFVTLNKQP